MHFFKEHQVSCEGDVSFIDNYLSKDMKVQHMDSYNTKGEKRFQGSFYYVFVSGNITSINTCNDAPLKLLQKASRYQTHICEDCPRSPHLVWTIWFDDVIEI